MADGAQPRMRAWGGQVGEAHRQGMETPTAAGSCRHQRKPHRCRAQSLSWAAKASSEVEVPRLEISKEQKGWQGPALTLTILLA